ncbi:Hypothetical protein (Fragment) [Durusdinium trenchii]|uniref:Uncharacterized protein n=2 Tax=Durusdinium trenchii TaxID=1381693 RepID=A0ABP0JCP4_9DINO
MAKRPRPPVRDGLRDAVPELLAAGHVRAAGELCREALAEGTEDVNSSGEVWYLLGVVHDIAHEHEEMVLCMRKALSCRERPEIWPYLADYATRSGDFDAAFLAFERLQQLVPSGVLGLQAASDARLLARTLRCRMLKRSCWAEVAHELTASGLHGAGTDDSLKEASAKAWRSSSALPGVQDFQWQWRGACQGKEECGQEGPDKSKAENRPSKEMMGMADFAEKHRHHGEDHGFDRSISSVFVWDNVFGPALLRALQQCADDFAIWRAKSPQRLLGFWLPSDSTPRTAPEVAARKLQTLLGAQDWDIEWWCRTQAPSLGAHFHYDTHPFLNEAYSDLRPEFTSVLFLSDVGGPTVVLNQQAQSGRHNPVLPQHGCAASSKVNRCFAFPGQLRHGAVALPNCSEEVRSGQKRSVVLYNFWPKGTPRTSECVQPDFSNYTPICSWAPTARHLLCETCLQRLQEEPCTAQRVELMDLTQPEDMDHSVPMEEPPDWLPVCGPNLLKTHGAVHFQWRLAANLPWDWSALQLQMLFTPFGGVQVPWGYLVFLLPCNVRH